MTSFAEMAGAEASEAVCCRTGEEEDYVARWRFCVEEAYRPEEIGGNEKEGYLGERAANGN